MASPLKRRRRFDDVRSLSPPSPSLVLAVSYMDEYVSVVAEPLTLRQ